MIYLIEHGQTALDARRESHGGRDIPLNKKGKLQAIHLGINIRNMDPKPDVILYSPRRRSEQTAKLAGHVARIPALPAAALAPLHSGGLAAGREPAASRRLRPWFARPNRQIPHGESVAAWRRRHLALLRRLLAAKRPVALVTHSNVIGSLTGGPEAALAAMAAPPQSARPQKLSIHLMQRLSKPS